MAFSASGRHVLVDQPGRAIHQRLERVRARGHLPQLVPDGAERGDRLAELPTARGVLRRFAEGRLAATRAHGAKLQSPEVEHVEGHLVTLANLPQQVGRGHRHLLQDDRRRRRAVQAHLVLFLAAADPAKGPFDDEGGEVFAVHLGEDNHDVGKTAVGDPHLLARQREAAVRLTGRLCPGAKGVRPRPRFAERVGADHLAGDQLRQIPLLLVVGAEHQDRQDAEVRLRAIRGAERGRPGDVLGHDERRHLVELDTAIGFRHVDAQQAQLTTSAQQPAGEIPVLLLEPIDGRHDFRRGELLGGLRDEPVIVGHALGRERTVRPRRFNQPGAAACRSRCRHWVDSEDS